MEMGQQLAHKLVLIAAAALIVLATGVGADSEELQLSPSAPGTRSSQSDQTQSPEKSSGPINQDGNWKQWMRLPQVSPFIDLPPLGTDLSKNASGGSDFRTYGTGGSTKPNDQFLFGVETQKTLQTPFRRTECATEDECADYSGLPKTESAKKSLKNFRKPFIGLSVTKPLQ